MSFLNSILSASALFAVTNIDDIFVLLAFFSDRRFRAREVVIGQYLGMYILIGGSILLALAAMAIPAQYIGLLGIGPIIIGIRKLFDKPWSKPAGDVRIEPSSAAFGKIFSVLAVTVANGGDNVGVYAPVFTLYTTTQLVITVVVFLACTAIWCAISHSMVNHAALGKPIRKWGGILLPFILIGLGVWIVLRGFIAE